MVISRSSLSIPLPLCLALNFYLGFSAIAIELITIRALGPLMGTNIFSTSINIAVVMLSLSLGYLISAYRKKGAQKQQILMATAVGGAFLFLSPWIALAFKNQAAPQSWIFTFSLAMALAPLFIAGIPCVIIGFCSAILLEAIEGHFSELRKTGAACFFSAGIGSLLGALTPNLFWIPAIGTSSCFIFMGVFFLLFSLALSTARLLQKLLVLILILMTGLGSCWVLRGIIYKPSTTIATFETPYHTIFVRRPSQAKLTLNYNIAISSQSTSPNIELLSFPFYAGLMLPFQYLSKNASSTVHSLILGSAGATVSSLAFKAYGNRYKLSITNVEIDPIVHDIAKKYFDADNPVTTFIAQDARSYVRTTKKIFNHVLIDAYANETVLPSELASVDFFLELRKIIATNGILQINVNTPVDHPIFKTLTANLSSSFRFIYYIPLPKSDPWKLVNRFLIASNEALDWKLINNQASGIDGFSKQLKILSESAIRLEPDKSWLGYDDSLSTETLALKYSLKNSNL